MALQEVQSFIKSHRAKLEQEKENLGAISQRRTSGILPEDSPAERRRDQLRRERQEEYRAFLKQQSTSKSRTRTIDDNPPPVRVVSSPKRPPSISISEKRRALAQDRKLEIQCDPHHHRKPPLPPLVREYRREESDNHHIRWRDKGHYSESQNNQFDEPLYDRKTYYNIAGRDDDDEYISRREAVRRKGKWDEPENNQRQVHIDTEDDGDRYIRRREYPSRRKHWDDEEQDLLEWARDQTRSRLTPKPPTSPPGQSSRRQPERVGGSSRSLSAPVASGIAALGARTSGEQEKRKKQKEYAEQLRQQMREKQAEKERDDYYRPEPRQSDADDRNKPGSSWRSKSYKDLDDYNRKSLPPRRRERVHFSPERNTAPSTKPPGEPASFPPYWPGLYYPPQPPPPLGTNFPAYPGAPQPGLPYYPPPPAMNNPYYSPYYPPQNPHAPTESSKEIAIGGGRMQRGRYSPHKLLLDRDTEEELKFTLRDGESEKMSEKVRREAYKLQLMEQMRKKQEAKQREKFEKSEFERKKEAEVYDPFGKGGCGAPIRDRRGQLVTDLKQMKKVNDERMMIGLPSTTPLPGELADGGAAGILDNSFTDRSTPRSSFELRRSKEGRKSVQEDYKETLEQQMREKEEKKRKEKERSSEEDRLEKERIEKECKMLEEKYSKERAMEKELKMKKEAMKREQEEREKEEAERKREEEMKLQEALKEEAEKKKQALIENMENQMAPYSQTRSQSPPIPTLRKLDPQSSGVNDVSTQPQPPQQTLSTSPPVPTLANKQMIANNNRGRASDEAYPTVNSAPTRVSPLPARTNTATIRKPVSESPDALKRSFSAHDALPQPIHTDNPSTGKVAVLNGPGSNGISQSTSDPYSLSSGIIPAQHHTAHITHSDDVMDNLLRNLHNVRKKLETERERVGANKPKEHAVTEDQQDRMPSGGKREKTKPTFLKPRVAVPKRKPTLPSDFYSPNNEPELQEKQDGEKVQQRLGRKQWKPIPKDQFDYRLSLTPPDQHRDTQQEDDYYSSSEGLPPPPPLHEPRGREGRKQTNRPPPPSWLQPQLPRVQQEPYSDLPHTKSNNPRPPSLGGESQFSMATLDVDRMARRNEERMRRLEMIMNSQARDSRPPKTILSDFLARNSRRNNHTSTSSYTGEASVRRPHPNGYNSHDGYHRHGQPLQTFEESESESDYPLPSLTPT